MESGLFLLRHMLCWCLFSWRNESPWCFGHIYLLGVRGGGGLELKQPTLFQINGMLSFELQNHNIKNTTEVNLR